MVWTPKNEEKGAHWVWTEENGVFGYKISVKGGLMTCSRYPPTYGSVPRAVDPFRSLTFFTHMNYLPEAIGKSTSLEAFKLAVHSHPIYPVRLFLSIPFFFYFAPLMFCFVLFCFVLFCFVLYLNFQTSA